MDLSKMPMWLAYILAPTFLLLVGGKVILNSESPLPLVAMIGGAGLVCAAVLHGYVVLKQRLFGRKDQQ
jgi:hypothetical protein